MKDLIDHIFSFHKVQLSVFPEFISFLKGRKAIIRIVIDNSNYSFDHGLFRKYGYFVKESILFSSFQKNSFGNLTLSIDENRKGEYVKVRMFSISTSKMDLEEFEHAELYGDVEKAGIFLGYPSCCTRNIAIINDLNEFWANYYLNDYLKNSLVANHLTNRFPITWGGISIVGELFPCSLSCENAIEYARNMQNDMINFGFYKIANVIVQHAKSTIFVNPKNGAISIFKSPEYEAIVFS
jgi:hypothetical protein